MTDYLKASIDPTQRTTKSTCDAVVALGASAGGLAPIERFFSGMPPGSGAAFVVIQHLSPDFKSLMKEILGAHTRFPIHRVEDGMVLQPDNIYLIPPKKNLAMHPDMTLRLSDQGSVDGHRVAFPIDVFFESMAQSVGDRSIGVVLSGTGTDGSKGIRAIDAEGGITLVEDPSRAQFDGMPRSAIATNCVRFIQPVEQLATTIYGLLAKRRLVTDEASVEVNPASGSIINETTQLLKTHGGVDFTHYKPGTISRRISRRMGLLGTNSPDDYLRLLAEDKHEIIALRNDLLIGVTAFMRDREAWRLLTDRVVLPMFDEGLAGEPVRAWVTACSTGEEAYSLAISLLEARRKSGVDRPIKIFATDLDRQAIEQASAGFFAPSTIEDLDPVLVERYFQPAESGFHVRRELREVVIFAEQNLIRDAPFTRMDIVSCRNMLIYLQQQLQDRVLASLLFALRPGGTLFLGPAETANEFHPQLESISERWKIYRKRLDAPAGMGPIMRGTAGQVLHVSPPMQPSGSVRSSLDRMLGDAVRFYLESEQAGCFVVAEDDSLYHTFSGGTTFLRVPEGNATTDITRLIIPSLRVPLSTGLHRARKGSGVVRYTDIEVQGCPGIDRVDIRLSANIDAIGTRSILVIITPTAETASGKADGVALDEHAQERLYDLESELRQTRENLQATIEELETTNEEQQATNEELISSNEQLQSTNEELQSVNEELYTVNTEHQSKIQQMLELHADMDHLLESTQIGTVFLDSELRIRKFTPAATIHIRLADIDIGRQIADLSTDLLESPLIELLERVNRTGESRQARVDSVSGRVLQLRVNPYRNGSSQDWNGVVLSIIDITELEQAKQAVVDKNRELEELISTISHDLKTPFVTIGGFAELLQTEIERSGAQVSTDYLRAICNAAERAHRSIVDLLECRRSVDPAEGGKVVDVQEVVDDVIREFKPVIEASGAQISSAIEVATIAGHRERISAAVENLVANAIHHGKPESGPPVIEIGSIRTDEDVRLFVRDHGPGVAEDEISRIFKLFERGTTSAEGTGIGLAIVERVAEQHGGRAWVESEAGAGSCFWMSFPGQAELLPTTPEHDATS